MIQCDYASHISTGQPYLPAFTGSQTQSPSAASNFTAIAAGFSWIRRADWSDGMARLGSLLTDLVGG